jgi:hypothetical protein
LINLIDTCIEESNDYINYLTEKLERMRCDMEAFRDEQAKLIKVYCLLDSDERWHH